ncbi:hypothetical protein SG34_006250 [Thalassomonas viridans]|uniref:Outer membrane protein beta-barrel domain-containing protein n=1 Tax=Thalassomonas viridans TaxID=137584 RepID=A0AAE9Z758_9GAMM|nr:hypothetical protein [Thalassomonas viridans]WDE06518.1 hypothetical protein SG34_006250 [Thalassomonas viridans]
MKSSFSLYGIVCGITVFISALLPVGTAGANGFEITPFIGQMYSTDINGSDGSSELSVSDDPHLGFAFSWQATNQGQGQILINAVNHDFTSDLDQQEHSIDIIYAHFSGVAEFKQQSYSTTVALGVGGAFFDADNGSSLYPSITTAIGTRYEFSKNLSLVTELRLYASLTDEDDDILCQSDTCIASFDGALWLDSAISVGIAYRF